MKTPQFLISLAAISGPSSEFEASTRIPIAEARAVVDFWRQAGSALWFGKDEAFDRRFRYRFLRLYEAAARGEPTEWLATADGALALVLLLDQFPRNAFRGTSRMYATDMLARQVVHTAIERGMIA
jgi:uncharacterized protein (DUF924 family)